MSHSEEQALVDAAKRGDTDAFATLMQTHQSKIYSLALRHCRNHEDAEELCQTTFLKAWQALPKFEGEASFFTWLYRLCQNSCIDHIRRQKRAREQVISLVPGEAEEYTLPDPGPGPEQQLLAREREAALRRALALLGAEHREVLILREFEGLSYQEIADTLSLSLGTVKSRVARARLALRDLLKEDGNFFSKATSN